MWSKNKCAILITVLVVLLPLAFFAGMNFSQLVPSNNSSSLQEQPFTEQGSFSATLTVTETSDRVIKGTITEKPSLTPPPPQKIRPSDNTLTLHAQEGTEISTLKFKDNVGNEPLANPIASRNIASVQDINSGDVIVVGFQNFQESSSPHSVQFIDIIQNPEALELESRN